MLALRRAPCAHYTAVANRLSSSTRTHMLAGASGASWPHQQPRRGMSISALFGFKWPFGSSDDSTSKKGKFDDILKNARQPRKRGCELAPTEAPEGLKLATFAGGCFWGLELAFARVPGVTETSVGYTGGQTVSPTYNEVCNGSTGHAEVVQCTYDPDQVTYRALLDLFFSRVDPTTLNRQGGDRGSQYRSAIYTHDEQQRQQALEKVAEVNEQLSQGIGGIKWLGRQVVTTVEPCGDYYLAESYHQQYLEKGGRLGMGQSAAKGCKDPIRCYG